ncbi:short-chain dehydrogenase [Chaetomium strumarium]|uniref:Short-chain dehydrogenase n=1 Tax=Chaetomium strumarium TaxID=1170767 RepID=A0AAJ0GT79_9PEZI|nr:short-chain dehydrogenase [Chaetomium strumarium]
MSASNDKLTILITGCSPGGMGAALAEVFHHAGHRVFATARNPSKLSPLAEQGIETLTLDVTSPPSIAAAVSSLTAALPPDQGLDMLINNAAGSYSMPIADISLDAARDLFNLNVWAHIAVTQALLPLLLRRSTTTTSTISTAATFQPMVVNHTSVGSVAALPFQGVYNASKAALAMLTATMRMELAPFGIRVVDLKTAGVKTNIISNNNVNNPAAGNGGRLPEGSIYAPAREVVERAMSQEELRGVGITAEQWAKEVAGLLLGKNPPAVIWKGESATVARVASAMPCNLFEGPIKKMTRMDRVEEIIRESRANGEA